MNFLMTELFKNIINEQYPVSGNMSQDKLPLLNQSEQNEVTAFSQLLHLMCDTSVPEGIPHFLAKAEVADTQSTISDLQNDKTPEIDDAQKVVSAVSVLLHRWIEHLDSNGGDELPSGDEGVTLPKLWHVANTVEDPEVAGHGTEVVPGYSEKNDKRESQESMSVSTWDTPDSSVYMSLPSLHLPLSSLSDEVVNLTPKVSFAFPMSRLVEWLMSIDPEQEAVVESPAVPTQQIHHTEPVVLMNTQTPISEMESPVDSNSNTSFMDENDSVGNGKIPEDTKLETVLEKDSPGAQKVLPEAVPTPSVQEDVDVEPQDTSKMQPYSVHLTGISSLYQQEEQSEVESEVEPVVQKVRQLFHRLGTDKLLEKSNESIPGKVEADPKVASTEPSAPSRRLGELPAERQTTHMSFIGKTESQLDVPITAVTDKSVEPGQKVDIRNKDATAVHANSEEAELEKAATQNQQQQDKVVQPALTEVRSRGFVFNQEVSSDSAEIDSTKLDLRTGLRQNNTTNIRENHREQVVLVDSEVESGKVEVSSEETSTDSSKLEHALENAKPAVNIPVSQTKNREPLHVSESQPEGVVKHTKPSLNRRESVENATETHLLKTSTDESVAPVAEASNARRPIVFQRQAQHSGMFDVELETEREALPVLRARVADMLHKSLRDEAVSTTRGNMVRVQFDPSAVHGTIVKLEAQDTEDQKMLQQLWRHLVLKVTSKEVQTDQGADESTHSTSEVFRSSKMTEETPNDTRSYPMKRLIQAIELKFPEQLLGWATTLRQKLDQPVLNKQDSLTEDASETEASGERLIRSLDRVVPKVKFTHENVKVDSHNLVRNAERLPDAMTLPYRQESLPRVNTVFRSLISPSVITRQSEGAETPGEAAEMTRPVALGVNRSVFNSLEQAIASERSAFEYPTRVPLDQLGRESVEAIRQMLAGREQRIYIKLHPESLGKVQIEVRSRHGEMSIRILSGNATVRKALEHQMGGLREALSREGIEVQRIEVSSQPVSNPVNDATQNAGRDAQRQDTAQRGGYRFSSSDNASDQESSRGLDRRRRHQGNLNVFV